MNKMSAIFVGLLIMASSTGFAKTYTCDITESNDPWSQPQDSIADELTATVDLKKGTVELSSSNELFGKNPFTVLTTAPSNIAEKYVKGIAVFAGTNIHEKTPYVFAFDAKTKTGSLEVYRKKSKDISDAKCR